MPYVFDWIVPRLNRARMSRRPTVGRMKLGAALAGLGMAVSACATPHNGEEAVRIGLVYPAGHGREFEERGKDHLAAYRRGIEEAGGVVTPIFQHKPRAETLAGLSDIDGVLLPGGGDVDPRFYGEPPDEKLGEHDADLDELEFAVLQFAEDHGLPVLAICRGHQVLNVFYNGSLYQDIPSQYRGRPEIAHRIPKDSGKKPFHPINVKKGSLLCDALTSERIDVHTSHHQAVKDVAPGFRVSAVSDDGVIEAIERAYPPYTMGVQFHPEKMMDEEPRVQALFARLVLEARKAPSRRGGHAA